MIFASFQHATFCFCGNNDYDKHGESTKCTKPCAGNTNELCGGHMANSVYKVQGNNFLY